MMALMPDGNTAALRQHEAQQDSADKRHDAYGERVMQDVLEELFSGRKVGRYVLEDFLPDLTDNDLLAILLDRRQDDVIDAVRAAQSKLRESIRAFFEEHEADYLADREREWDADAKAEAQSWRDE